jgi:hypothetical protein
VQISLAKVAVEVDEAVSEPKPVDVGHITNDMSVLVGIGREVVVLLKCILVLLFLVLVGTLYILIRLPYINRLSSGVMRVVLV